MKRFCSSSLFLALAIGCGQNNPPPVTSTPVSSEPPATASQGETLPEGAMLVTLKLPEMT
jgi:hypothetical protein